jgi:hypothetical protein
VEIVQVPAAVTFNVCYVGSCVDPLSGSGACACVCASEGAACSWNGKRLGRPCKEDMQRRGIFIPLA